MKKFSMSIFTLLLLITPTLQMAAMESENEHFKQQLLEELREEIKDLSPAEIRAIIDAVEQSLNEYIEHYEETPEEELLTKDELLLRQYSNVVSIQQMQTFMSQSDKPRDQVILEGLNPKLKLLSDDDYHYNEEKGEIEFTISKDAMFNKGSDSMLQVFNAGWHLLEKGDVLINLDNGSSAGLFKWGHAAMMYRKGSKIDESSTIEAPGPGKRVQLVNYQTGWHANRKNRIAYNYVPSLYNTNKPARAADNAMRYIGKGYSLYPVLGNTSTIYCTELVFLAYKSQGVNLGNGMDTGSWGILMPKSMYCDADLMYYYRQNFTGGVC